jgi:hypothetical protein
MIHLVNFKAQFAASVLRGRKRQTMRLRRKRPIQEGDTLRLYTGLRTKEAVLLREVEVKEVRSCRLFEGGIFIDTRSGLQADWTKGDSQAGTKLANADGFADYDEMLAFFKKLYGEQPIHLELIKW